MAFSLIILQFISAVSSECWQSTHNIHKIMARLLGMDPRHINNIEHFLRPQGSDRSFSFKAPILLKWLIKLCFGIHYSLRCVSSYLLNKLSNIYNCLRFSRPLYSVLRHLTRRQDVQAHLLKALFGMLVLLLRDQLPMHQS